MVCSFVVLLVCIPATNQATIGANLPRKTFGDSFGDSHKVFDTFWDRQRDGKRSFFAQSGNSNNKFLSFNYVFNDIFLQSSVRSKSDQRSVRKNIVQVFIHGHSLIDEAAFSSSFTMVLSIPDKVWTIF